MNTVPQIEYDDEKDINILKGQLIEIKKKLLAYDDVEEILYDAIEEQNWFIENVKEWLWLDKEEGIDDILKVLKEFKAKNEKIY